LNRLILPTLIIVLFALAAVALTQATVSADEAHALWTVRDVAAPDTTFTGALRSDLRELFNRLQEQPQPPLYLAALDAWTTLFGQQIEAARVLSLLMTAAGVLLVGLAARLEQVSPPLAMLLATALSLYAATQAYVFAGVLASGALSWIALRLYSRRPNLLRGGFYTLTAAAVLYTAHIAPPLTLLHGWIAWRENRLRAWLLAFIPAVIVFLPWLLLFQSRDLADFAPVTVAISWLMVLVPAAAIEGARLWAADRAAPRRYAMPGLAVLAALIALLWTGAINSGEPAAIVEVRAQRADTEPALTYFSQRHPLSYYNTQPTTRINGGIALDLAWQDQTAATIAAAVDAVRSAPAVWVMMPENHALAAQTADLLRTSHTPGLDLAADGLRFTRFDRNSDD